MGKSKTNTLPPLHTVASTDELRLELTGVYIDGKFAVATDAHVLAVVDVSEEFEPETLEAMNGKIIPAKVWQQMCESVFMAKLVTADNEGVSWQLVSPSGRVFYNYLQPSKPYPNYKAVVPVSESACDQTIEKIGVNIKNVSRLLKALMIEDNTANMILVSSNKAVIIRSKELKGFGVVMPVMSEDVRYEVLHQIAMEFGINSLTQTTPNTNA